MKKIVKILITVILATVILASCIQEDSPEMELNFGDYSTDTTDFYGYTCEIIQSYPIEEPFKYRQDTLGADLALKRVSNIENELNCEIEIVQKSSVYLESLIPLLIAGEYVGEIACSHQPSNLAKSGVLYPLDELNEYIDYMDSAKYGSLGILEQGMFNGIPYSVSPLLWLEKQASYSYDIFAFNANLAKKYNLDDPRDYHENGEWTWDKFEEYISNSTIYDGEITVKSFVSQKAIIDNFAFYNGFEYTMLSADNKPISGVSSENLSEAIDWMRNLFINYRENIEIVPDSNTAVEYFLSNKAILFQTSFAHLIENVVYEMENFGVVPFPWGPKGIYGKHYGPVGGMDSFAVWYNAKEPEAAALIINMLLEPLDGYETQDDLISQANSIFFDTRDAEFYINNLNDTRWDYWTIGLNSHWSNILNEIISGKTAAEILTKYGQQMDALIDEYIMGNAEFIEEWKEQH